MPINPFSEFVFAVRREPDTSNVVLVTERIDKLTTLILMDPHTVHKSTTIAQEITPLLIHSAQRIATHRNEDASTLIRNAAEMIDEAAIQEDWAQRNELLSLVRQELQKLSARLNDVEFDTDPGAAGGKIHQEIVRAFKDNKSEPTLWGEGD